LIAEEYGEESAFGRVDGALRTRLNGQESEEKERERERERERRERAFGREKEQRKAYTENKERVSTRNLIIILTYPVHLSLHLFTYPTFIPILLTAVLRSGAHS